MKNFLISSWWSEGVYVDLWSLNHFLFGVIMASFFIWIGYNFLPSLFISVALMIAWEIFEVWHESIFEHAPNMIIDVVVGLLGFLIIHYLLTVYSHNLKAPTVLIVSLLLFILLEIVGYYNFINRTGDYSINTQTDTTFAKKEHDTINS